MNPPPEARVIVPIAEIKHSRIRVEPSSLVQVNPTVVVTDRTAAVGGEYGIVAVRIVNEPLLYGSGGVDERRDVPVGVLLRIDSSV